MDPEVSCEFCEVKYTPVSRGFCNVQHCGRKRCVDLCEECQEWIGIITEMEPAEIKENG